MLQGLFPMNSTPTFVPSHRDHDGAWWKATDGCSVQRRAGGLKNTCGTCSLNQEWVDIHFTFSGEVVAGLCYFIWEGERLAKLSEDRLLLDEGLEVHANDGDHGGTSVLELLKDDVASVESTQEARKVET